MTDDIARPFQAAVNGDAGPTPDLGVAPILRRGRGRPRKDGGLSAPVSPNATAIPPESAAPKGKPGRKPKKQVMSEEQKTALGKQICGLHMMASLMFGIPELVLQPQEADMMANALVAVADEYGLALSGKTGAAIQLAGTAAMIYLPRYFAMNRRIQSGQVNPPENQDTNGTVAASVN